MRISRIPKIRGHRVFRDFAWPAGLHPFGQFNLIYGWNGSGKTALSALFRHLQDRTTLTEGDVEFEFDEATKIAGADLSSATLPPVRVFNRDFVAATISVAGSTAPIYFLGADSVEKQNEVETLKKDLTWAETEVQAARSEKSNADKALDDFCIGKAKLIKELLLGSRNHANYNKSQFAKAIQGMTDEASTAALLSDADKERLRKQKEAQPKASVPTVTVAVPDFERLVEHVTALLERCVVSQVLEELTADHQVGSWVQAGLTLHSGQRETETCRFCGQGLPLARRAALAAHFNDEFSRFQTEVAEAEKLVERHRAALTPVSFPDESRVYDYLAGELTPNVAEARGLLAQASAFLEKLKDALSRKKGTPFEQTAFPDVEPAARPSQAAIEAAIATVNSVITKHEAITREFQGEVDKACQTLELAAIAEAHSEHRDLRDAVTRADTGVQTAADKPKQLRTRIEDIEREIVEHMKPAEELNGELRAYLGRDELRFDVKDTGYVLTRAGQPASHLSEGEKTAIAFLYFLKSLQDKSFALASGIVVVDDPVSSLDANALFSAFGYMKERTKTCGQLFVLTHNFAFLRLVKNWFHHLPKQKSPKVERRPGRFFLLRAYCGDDATARTAALGPIDPLLERYESEYHYLFRRVSDEANRGESDAMLEEHYSMPNIARRLVESFLAFRHPDCSGDLAKRMELVDFESEKKTRILRLLNTYSHSGGISEPEHDPSVLSETRPVLREVLKMIETADPTHYASMVRLVASVHSDAGGAVDTEAES